MKELYILFPKNVVDYVIAGYLLPTEQYDEGH